MFSCRMMSTSYVIGLKRTLLLSIFGNARLQLLQGPGSKITTLCSFRRLSHLRGESCEIMNDYCQDLQSLRLLVSGIMLWATVVPKLYSPCINQSFRLFSIIALLIGVRIELSTLISLRRSKGMPHSLLCINTDRSKPTPSNSVCFILIHWVPDESTHLWNLFAGDSFGGNPDNSLPSFKWY